MHKANKILNILLLENDSTVDDNNYASQLLDVTNNDQNNDDSGVDSDMYFDSIEILRQALADLNVLTFKVKNCHWNVEGSNFFQLHNFLDDEYSALTDVIDRVAERIRALKEKTLAGMAYFLSITSLHEVDGLENFSDNDMLNNLLDDYQFIIQYLRINISNCDDVTENFFQDIITALEKTSWKIRSFLK